MLAGQGHHPERHLALTFSDLQADIAADLIRRGLDVHKGPRQCRCPWRALGHTNMGVYAEVMAGGEIAIGDALLMKSAA